MRRFMLIWPLVVFAFLSGRAAAQSPDLLAGVEHVFDRPAALAELRHPKICILDIQHPDSIRRQVEGKSAGQYNGWRTKSRVEEITGLPCLLVHYSEVPPDQLRQPNLKAILISGRSEVISKELDRRFYPLIRETRIPIFGFCGGMQLIGEAFGVKVEPMRKLREGEKDPNPNYRPGWFKEWGFLPVKVVQRDPLFAGLPDEVLVRQAHAEHALEPPPGFVLLASTAECRVQAIKHKDQPIYGTQFHPEAYDDAHPHGRTILENFFRTVGIMRKDGPGAR
jgi:GMP synthase-like glutamine amidotransferase